MKAVPDVSVSELARVCDSTADLLGRVRRDQWANTTPCPQWSVADLMNHLIVGNLYFSAMLGDLDRPDNPGDMLGDDPAGAYRSAAQALQAAFGCPGVEARIYRSPIGPASGAMLLHIRIVEQLVHGWDIARATDQSLALPAQLDELAHQELVVSRALLDDSARRASFAPAAPVPDDAPALDRLAAYLGRPVQAD